MTDLRVFKASVCGTMKKPWSRRADRAPGAARMPGREQLAGEIYRERAVDTTQIGFIGSTLPFHATQRAGALQGIRRFLGRCEHRVFSLTCAFGLRYNKKAVLQARRPCARCGSNACRAAIQWIKRSLARGLCAWRCS